MQKSITTSGFFVNHRAVFSVIFVLPFYPEFVESAL